MSGVYPMDYSNDLGLWDKSKFVDMASADLRHPSKRNRLGLTLT